MSFRKENLDTVLVPTGLLLLLGYHLFLLYRCLRLPHTTVIGLENNDKRAWVNSKDTGTALTVISTSISAATFLGSVSLTLSSLIGAWIANNPTIFQSGLIYGDTRPLTMSLKFISLIIFFLLAFASFLQSARCFLHANYLISAPGTDIPVKNVEVQVIRGGNFWTLGHRALHFALCMLLWLFGPIPMFATTLAMVGILHYLDTNTTPLHRHRLPGMQRVGSAGSGRVAAVTDAEDVIGPSGATMDKKDIGVALNVLSTNISAATSLGSVSLALSSLIGAWIANDSNIFRSELIYGDTSPSTMSIKYMSLIICFLLAFSCFVQSARCLIHANYLISTPDSSIPVRNVELQVIRGGDFWSIGLRALYFALCLLLWFFGPIPMFATSLAMVGLLHHLDTNTTPLHRHRTLGKRPVKRADDEHRASAATDFEDYGRPNLATSQLVNFELPQMNA
ncbi:hypothetical protein RJ640_030023 [Escallonia rubra]|uniref:Uncharacterized protein n=1 Tax=Escallonia rubra TaxID=112253 RepID=A0AA88RL45_9ASTE|nr:hypothetical protein RJ640_030023 [Escallonia rubra]